MQRPALYMSCYLGLQLAGYCCVKGAATLGCTATQSNTPALVFPHGTRTRDGQRHDVFATLVWGGGRSVVVLPEEATHWDPCLVQPLYEDVEVFRVLGCAAMYNFDLDHIVEGHPCWFGQPRSLGVPTQARCPVTTSPRAADVDLRKI